MLAPVLMPAPVLFPGRCLCCGRSKGAMVDTMVDDDGFGRVYLCLDVCVPGFAALAGLADTAKADENAAALQRRVVELETELAEAEPVLSAMEKAAERFAARPAPVENPRKRKAA